MYAAGTYSYVTCMSILYTYMYTIKYPGITIAVKQTTNGKPVSSEVPTVTSTLDGVPRAQTSLDSRNNITVVCTCTVKAEN